MRIALFVIIVGLILSGGPVDASERIRQFTVTTFTKNLITMVRNDDAALGAVSGTYTGRRVGNSAHGEATTSNGLKTPWDASW